MGCIRRARELPRVVARSILCGMRHVTVIERVKALLQEKAPQAICDDCITSDLGLSIRQHANHKTRELAQQPLFDRRKDRCAQCGEYKLVIRHA